MRYNPDNRLLALIWMQGEFDLTTAEYAHQPALFQAMVARFRADMADMAPQMAGGAGGPGALDLRRYLRVLANDLPTAVCDDLRRLPALSVAGAAFRPLDV